MPPQETKDRILDAAEELFARRGFAATSMRRLTREAEVNLAAVHYHFGSKEALIQAVFARRRAPLHRERMDGREQLERDAGGGPVESGASGPTTTRSTDSGDRRAAPA